MVRFINTKKSSFLQAICRCISILHLWSSVQRVEHCDLFTEICTRLKDTGRDIFSNVDGSIIYGLDLLHRRQSTTLSSACVSLCFFLFYHAFYFGVTMCILAMQKT